MLRQPLARNKTLDPGGRDSGNVKVPGANGMAPFALLGDPSLA
ncbi:hypothetical protein [uncultured Sphingomonas sp.]